MRRPKGSLPENGARLYEKTPINNITAYLYGIGMVGFISLLLPGEFTYLVMACLSYSVFMCGAALDWFYNPYAGGESK